MSNLIMIFNTCSGWKVINNKNIFPYNNPFIGSLIVNDEQYITFVNNIFDYLNYTPILGEPSINTKFYQQTGNKYYQHKDINTPYPVIFIKDLEIHYIHEKNFNDCLNKVKKRFLRMKELILNQNFKIFALLSFGELINDHKNFNKIISDFTEQSNNNNIYKIFIGPTKYCLNKNCY